jgi:hypothetical protein
MCRAVTELSRNTLEALGASLASQLSQLLGFQTATKESEEMPQPAIEQGGPSSTQDDVWLTKNDKRI